LSTKRPIFFVAEGSPPIAARSLAKHEPVALVTVLGYGKSARSEKRDLRYLVQNVSSAHKEFSSHSEITKNIFMTQIEATGTA
jgi:hypothetical protein